ncbi:hypothetical protein N7478_010633 [Penicillium angulare]|uniref:uncharacterized protein n=1 Tax=Penicillium angulare TaxID=116970 RepID=UPI0025415713|nr:uncharacterized protein N7478_010633 [Penicillium angulare]KAJ5267825.1 hypothetical protein N7478_010633 [Penicillium angulare]
MSVTVYDLMRYPSRPPIFVDNEITVSRKPWTREYKDFKHSDVKIWPPTIDAVDRFLGPRLEEPSIAEYIGLQTPAYMLNAFNHEVESEADVTRDFNQSMVPCLAAAFSGPTALTSQAHASSVLPGGPMLWPKSQIPPTGSTSSLMVDYQMTLRHSSGRNLELAIMIGEMKRPRVIRREEWLSQRDATTITSRLQQELRGYAYEYKCPHVFLFDSSSLVIVQFRAEDRKDIKSQDCIIDCCVIPRELDRAIENQCTMQYALYKLTAAGWKRGATTLDSRFRGSGERVRAQTPLCIGEYRRDYVWYSGEPTFFDSYNRECSIPVGYKRIFLHRLVEGRNGRQKPGGFWVWTNGRNMVDDTLDCFI